MESKISPLPKTLQILIVELPSLRQYKLGRHIATATRTYCGPFATLKASVALLKLGADDAMPGWKIRRCALTKKPGGEGELTVTYMVSIDAGARAALKNIFEIKKG